MATARGSGYAGMITDWLAYLQDLAVSAYEVFLWPGIYILTELPVYAPDLAAEMGVGTGQNGIVITGVVSAVAWTLAALLAWKIIKTIAAHTWYAGLRIKTFLVSRAEVLKRRRVLSEPVPIPDVELDELDLAVLNTGSTLPPGLALTAAELSGQLTQRPTRVQQSLDKLRSYGLIDDTISQTNGVDNYYLTRSGAALLSMWQQHGVATPRISGS